jgi:hypothetical protein
MDKSQYERLLDKLPEVADVVNRFSSEGAQVEALKAILGAIGTMGDPAAATAPPLAKESKGPAGLVPKLDQEGSDIPPSEAAVGEGVDTPIAIANRLKERADFHILQEKVLHARQIWPKMQLVMYESRRPLTSGEIADTLQSFQLKTDYSSVSHKLADMAGKVRNTESRKPGANPGYELTGPARSEFGEWLNDALK